MRPFLSSIFATPTGRPNCCSAPDRAVAVLRTVGDVLVGEALASTTSRAREGYPELAEVPTLLQVVVSAKSSLEVRETRGAQLGSIAAAIPAESKAPQRIPFHWPIEFPEVFGREQGFHAFVGNPPFQGGQYITGALGTDYRDYLVDGLAEGKRGSADLCVVFLS